MLKRGYSYFNSACFEAVPSERAETFAISVKTSNKFHKTRVSDILDTWYQDAGHEVYFFTDSRDKKLKAQLGDHLIETHCSTGHDSLLNTSKPRQTYLEEKGAAVNIS
ncbi:hypothetical protein TELCIR_12087 [Teladorsagia circumcincta]|uniref:Fringe-like glycosyltransferase domain-containing protein n=1 Tax=Teladorsagia circumcincta TaxID=45464 RepID=A0A2G9T4Q5_TELCI|nr:hypothetical protein TELCIR_12087 [Teladorsagia circumcincta]